MKKIDLLTLSDIYKLSKNKQSFFKENNFIADFTDYAYYSINNEYMSKKGRWWLKSGDGEGNVDVVCEDGKNHLYEADSPCIGTRPIINYSDVKTEIRNININKQGLLECEWGEYIQRLVSCDEKIQLEQLYLNCEISYTGKSYEVIMPYKYTWNECLNLKRGIEYIYNNHKFVRVVDDDKITWFQVLPIKWLISINDDIMVTKEVIIGRIPMRLKDEYYIENMFEYTDMYKYLNNVFLGEIIPSQQKNKSLRKQK